MSLRYRRNFNKKSKRLFGGAAAPGSATGSVNVAAGPDAAPGAAAKDLSVDCPSDHLPMLYQITFNNPSIPKEEKKTVLQMNLLAQGLAEDGFLGGSNPKLEPDQKFMGTIDFKKEDMIKLQNFLNRDEIIKKGKKEVNVVNVLFDELRRGLFEHESVSERVAVPLPYPTNVAELLKRSKFIWEELELAERCIKKQTDKPLDYKNDGEDYKIALYTFYKYMQIILGVNNKINIPDVEIGPWAQLVAETVTSKSRIEYMEKLINETKPDIVCFQEDDFSWEFMPKCGYVCNLEGPPDIVGIFRDFELFEGFSKKTPGLESFYRRNKPEYYFDTVNFSTQMNAQMKAQMDTDLNYNYKPARFAKQNSNCRNQGPGKHDDGTTIWWKKGEAVENITLFQISKTDKKKGKELPPNEQKTEGAVHVKFENGLHVISTHLSSGRDKNSARRLEVGRIINHIANNIKVTDPLLIAGDFNEHPVFPLNGVDYKKIGVEPGEIPKEAFLEASKGSMSIGHLFVDDYKWWDGVKHCKDFTEFQTSSATNVSVFKVRGPGTAQVLKANEYEHQLIDWNFGRNIEFDKARTLDNLRSLVFPNHKNDTSNNFSEGCIIKRGPVTNPKSYNDVSQNQIFQQMLLPNKVDKSELGREFNTGMHAVRELQASQVDPVSPAVAAQVALTAARPKGGARSRKRRQKRSTKRRQQRQKQRPRRVSRRRQRKQSNKRQRR